MRKQDIPAIAVGSPRRGDVDLAAGVEPPEHRLGYRLHRAVIDLTADYAEAEVRIIASGDWDIIEPVERG
jgi:hypothetical protein